MGPALLAELVAAMGPGFIASLSASLSTELFTALFGAAPSNTASGVDTEGLSGGGASGDDERE